MHNEVVDVWHKQTVKSVPHIELLIHTYIHMYIHKSKYVYKAFYTHVIACTHTYIYMYTLI